MPEAHTNDPKRIELAQRFGMTPDTLERLLTNTHSEYASSKPETSTRAPIVTPAKTTSSGGLMAAILVALFVILGVTMSFNKGCFEQRHHAIQHAAKPVDTVQNMLNQQTQAASTPPVTPSDVGPNEVPPEALIAPREEPNASHTGITTMQQAVRSTTSNFEAQEQLAQMKSEGKSKAHIVRSKRQGVPRYEVRDR